jgi:hypothetical protein
VDPVIFGEPHADIKNAEGTGISPHLIRKPVRHFILEKRLLNCEGKCADEFNLEQTI